MTTPAVTVTAMLSAQDLVIHQAGIDGGSAAFETTAATREAFDATRLAEHRLVAVDADSRVPGQAAVVPVSDRCAHAGWSSTPSTSALARRVEKRRRPIPRRRHRVAWNATPSQPTLRSWPEAG
ncbi:hypothetical protein ACWERV_04385 [Streptomyces sp. NPDC004031]